MWIDDIKIFLGGKKVYFEKQQYKLNRSPSRGGKIKCRVGPHNSTHRVGWKES